MLNVQTEIGLANLLSMEVGQLRLAAEFADRYIDELKIWSPFKEDKPREVISVGGELRLAQDRLYHRLLAKRLTPSIYSHGGVAGRSPITNVRPHIDSQFFYAADISGFFPSISNSRVNRLFLKSLRCAPTVARLLTRLCTHDFHLALGLVTSPILADEILKPFDQRIVALCNKRHLQYTRFVDDITISGGFELEGTSIPKLVKEIVKDCGFHLKKEKQRFGNDKDGIVVTGVRIKNGKVDVPQSYLIELERQLSDHASLASGGPFDGPLLTSSQLAGRVYHACWINRGRQFALLRKLNALQWSKIWGHAQERGLLFARKKITERNSEPPDYTRCYGHHESIASTKVRVKQKITSSGGGDNSPPW